MDVRGRVDQGPDQRSPNPISEKPQVPHAFTFSTTGFRPSSPNARFFEILACTSHGFVGGKRTIRYESAKHQRMTVLF